MLFPIPETIFLNPILKLYDPNVIELLFEETLSHPIKIFSLSLMLFPIPETIFLNPKF